ncbi:hypothetical protein DPEC_G00113020 [Dallia pectoralis]|uniref:Uncharacterized protein n=1 Tax=Dallia pectoralis TaxID=75939 RepID=A0ACC2GTM6_DALPE|nr:hypothetical protein DPEC_G00113020 [Dallia pectoralis]
MKGRRELRRSRGGRREYWRKDDGNAGVRRLGGREWETNSLKKHLTKPSGSASSWCRGPGGALTRGRISRQVGYYEEAENKAEQKEPYRHHRQSAEESVLTQWI